MFIYAWLFCTVNIYQIYYYFAKGKCLHFNINERNEKILYYSFKVNKIAHVFKDNMIIYFILTFN